MENPQFEDQDQDVSTSKSSDKLSMSQSAKMKKLLASSPLEGIETKQNAKIITPSQQKKLKRSEKQNTSGSGWFDLPLGEVTEEVKTDFKILKLRNYLGEKRRFKDESIPKEIPKFFHVLFSILSQSPGRNSGRRCVRFLLWSLDQ
jgi:hypothetical protein